MNKINYNPDVLTCLANLSNDEVFTPPTIVNQMLDTLPKELWHNSKAKFLDPFSKSGVFLREIAKRLIDGLEKEIPELNEGIVILYSVARDPGSRSKIAVYSENEKAFNIVNNILQIRDITSYQGNREFLIYQFLIHITQKDMWGKLRQNN